MTVISVTHTKLKLGRPAGPTAYQGMLSTSQSWHGAQAYGVADTPCDTGEGFTRQGRAWLGTLTLQLYETNGRRQPSYHEPRTARSDSQQQKSERREIGNERLLPLNNGMWKGQAWKEEKRSSQRDRASGEETTDLTETSQAFIR